MNSGRAAGRSLAIIALSAEGQSELPRPGLFMAVTAHVLPDGATLDWLAARQAAIAMAREAGADWMIVLAEGEELADDALELASPALDLYDAVFGAANARASKDAVARLTRLAFDSADRLPHALLNWWMPEAHLVRVDSAQGVIDKIAGQKPDKWPLEYLFEIWASARCLKVAQPLLELQAEPTPLDPAGKDFVLRRLAIEPEFLPVQHGDTVYFLPYTGRNAGIEREQSRGLFYEAMELEELRKIVGTGARIVDVGANTGNHTVFFAGPMKAAMVTPFEAFPDAAAILRKAVARNRLDNVDLSHLGVGVAEQSGTAKLVFSTRGGLGATSLALDPDGKIGVATLDSMVSGPVDLMKIDVEGMEMQVLAGAEKLIGQSRPLIFIEIASANTMVFVDWLRGIGYEVVRIFTDKGHANYLIAPAGVA